MMINLNQSEKNLYGILGHHLINNPQEFLVAYFGVGTYGDLITLSRAERPLPNVLPMYIREIFDQHQHDIVRNYLRGRLTCYRLPGISEVLVTTTGFVVYPGSVFAPMGHRIYGMEDVADVHIQGYLLISLTKRRAEWNRLFRVARNPNFDAVVNFTANSLFKVALIDAAKVIEQHNRALLGRGPNRPRWLR